MENTHFESLYPETTRFSEIAKLLEFVKQGNSCQIIAFPGVGRSNLLRLLPYNRNLRLKHLGENQKWFHFVTTDFSEIRRRPLLDATKFLFLSLVDSLRERRMQNEYEKVNQMLKESLKLNDELVMFSGLKKAIDFLAIEKELTVVYLFDRFEEYVPMLTPNFFSNLRILRNRAKYRFSAVFSLNRPLEDLLEPTLFADFYEFLAGHTIYLELMDKTGLDFRVSYLEKVTGKKIDKKVLDKIISLTGGHGKLMRTTLETVLTDSSVILERIPIKSGEAIESPSKHEILSRSLPLQDDIGKNLLKQKTVRGSLIEIWQSLTPSEQNELFKGSSLIRDDPYLQNTGLIKDERITIPLFEEFVKEQSRLRQGFGEAKQAIIYDKNANEIKKGEIILSDQLTSFEFKLLRFLIQNPDRIIDREEIIQAVWKETQSTAGVTEQALDQLIFRLRKKIEQDPNNPQHIVTVKGRGVRFSP